MYDEVLLPVDGNDGADPVIDHVGTLAEWADATVTVLYVADTTRDSVTTVGGRVVDALVSEGEEVVEAAADRVRRTGAAVETDVVQGTPAPTIVDYLERYGHDLVAVPTHGRSGVERYLQGSVAERVVRLSPVPVLVSRMQGDERLGFPYEDILVPTDGSDGAERGVGHAVALAGALEARVHALSAVGEAPLGLSVGEAEEEPAREAVAAVAEAAGADGPPVETHVRHGDATDVIRAAIEDLEVDAVVMGTTGRGATRRLLLGSVTEATVRSAPVPVVTVGPEE